VVGEDGAEMVEEREGWGAQVVTEEAQEG
jgi:hypothetical protein